MFNFYNITSFVTQKICLNHFRTMSKEPKTFASLYRNFWTPKPLGPPYGHVIQIGDPVLRAKADPVPVDLVKTIEIQTLVKQLRYVLNKYNSVGLSAPQIGISLRVFVIEFNSRREDEYTKEVYKLRQMSTTPFTVFINPEMKVINYEKNIYPEACESVRGYHGDVSRYQEVLVTGLDTNGNTHSLQAKGWTARILQHEMDHMDGKIYTDVMDRSTFACGCWQAVNAKHGRITIPFSPK